MVLNLFDRDLLALTTVLDQPVVQCRRRDYYYYYTNGFEDARTQSLEQRSAHPTEATVHGSATFNLFLVYSIVLFCRSSTLSVNLVTADTAPGETPITTSTPGGRTTHDGARSKKEGDGVAPHSNSQHEPSGTSDGIRVRTARSRSRMEQSRARNDPSTRFFVTVV